MELLISALVCIIGLLMYALAANPKLQEIGRIMFAFGLLVSLFVIAPEWVKLFPR